MSVIEKSAGAPGPNPINDIPVSKSPSIFQGVLAFGLLSGVAYFASLLKTLVITRYFGTSAQMDAYAMAVLVPNLLAALLAGSCSASIVPVLAQIEHDGREERAGAWRAGYIIFAGACALVSLGLFLFAAPIMSHVAIGFDPERLALSIRLLRLASPFVILNAAYAFASADLLSRKKFAVVAAAPAISTIVSIAVIVGFRSLGISSLVWGLILGTAIQAFALSLPAWRANASASRFRLWTPAVRMMLAAHAPLIVVSLFGVTNSFVDQAVAGFLPVGNVSALNYANTINSFVVQATAMALSWIVLPEFSSLAASGNTALLKEKARRCIKAAAMIAAPASVLVFIGGKFAVRLLLQHGAFNADSTHVVYLSWAGYTVGLLPLSIGILGARILNALRENRFLAKLGLVSLVANALLDFIFMHYWGALGITLSTSVVYCITSVVIFRFLYARIGLTLGREVWKYFGRVALACLLAGIPALLYGSGPESPTRWIFSNTAFIAIVAFLYLRFRVVKSFRGMLAEL